MSIENLFVKLKQLEVHDEIKKIENMISAMQETDTGILFKSQKVFLTTIPAAVSGDSLIGWIEDYLKIDNPHEASHIASILMLCGYVYPLTDYKSTVVKDDPTPFYRFQAPYYWLSKIPKPGAMDYAIYLVKRTLRKNPKYNLEEYEQTALHRLQNMLSHKWEFICMQAADQVRLYKDKRKSDQIVLEAQERAFWRVHQPPPNKLSRFEERLARNRWNNRRPLSWRRGQTSILLCKDLALPSPLPAEPCPPVWKSPSRPQSHQHAPLPHSHLRLSNKKSIENLLLFTANRSSYDWFLSEGGGAGTPNASPWLSQPGDFDTTPCLPLVGLPTCDSLLDQNLPLGSCLHTLGSATHDYGDLGSSPTVNEVRLWATSFDNLLWDPKGCRSFKAFLEKEFSSENLRFWLAVNAYQFTSVSNLRPAGLRIYEEFLAPNAPSEINIDCSTRTVTAEALQNPSWFVFLEAKQHIYKLMKSDSYARFLRSEDYSVMLRVALADQQSFGPTKRSSGKSPVTTATIIQSTTRLPSEERLSGSCGGVNVTFATTPTKPRPSN